MRKSLRRIICIFERVFNTYDTLNNVVQEDVKGIRVVKSFVQEDYEVQKFEKVSDDIYKDFSRAEAILAFNNPLMQLAIYIIITFLVPAAYQGIQAY